jgi:hypothetical protein
MAAGCSAPLVNLRVDARFCSRHVKLRDFGGESPSMNCPETEKVQEWSLFVFVTMLDGKESTVALSTVAVSVEMEMAQKEEGGMRPLEQKDVLEMRARVAANWGLNYGYGKREGVSSPKTAGRCCTNKSLATQQNEHLCSDLRPEQPELCYTLCSRCTTLQQAFRGSFQSTAHQLCLRCRKRVASSFSREADSQTLFPNQSTQQTNLGAVSC